MRIRNSPKFVIRRIIYFLPITLIFLPNLASIKLMKSLLSYIISAGLGLWLSTLFVAGVFVKAVPNSNFFGLAINTQWQLFILLGIILGLLNYFAKPILSIITLPLQIISLGLFSFIINMGLIWILDVIFQEFSAPLLLPLIWTTIIVWTINILLSNSVLKIRD